MNRSDLDQTCINAIRVLTIDAVQKANSGHCGLPMGMAPAAYLLYTRFMRHNPKNPKWFGRDRFVLSAGHGSMLLYSLLYLTGYDLGLDDIKQFRQLGSRTPGHPEHGLTPGVETTTGPLGQGIGNAVGMAMAAKHLEAHFERDNSGLFDHRIFGICGDGDLMEGVASEAASIAGHVGLGNIVLLYDDNHVTIDGHTELSFDEDVVKRFDAYKWHTQDVADANDLEASVEGHRKWNRGDQPPVADSRALDHRLRQPAQAGHLGRAQQSARRRRGEAHQGILQVSD